MRMFLVSLVTVSTLPLGCESAPTERLNVEDLLVAGNSQYEQGHYQEALQSFSKAINLDPSSSRALNNRGLARAALADLDGAIADYDSSLSLPNPLAEAYYNRGVARLRKGDRKDAV